MGDFTKRISWIIAALLPVAALSASEVPWQWGFVGVYVGVSFVLYTLVRFKNVEVERFVHILVLSGSAPIVVRSYFGMDLTFLGVVHVAAVIAICVGIGSLLAHQVRPRLQGPNAA